MRHPAAHFRTLCALEAVRDGHMLFRQSGFKSQWIATDDAPEDLAAIAAVNRWRNAFSDLMRDGHIVISGHKPVLTDRGRALLARIDRTDKGWRKR